MHYLERTPDLSKTLSESNRMASRGGGRSSAAAADTENLERVHASSKLADAGDVDDEDSTTLEDEAKAPPRRASIGWGSEPAADDKSGDGSTVTTSATSAASGANEAKRSAVGRRRRGSETQSDAKNAKNRHFDDDGDANGAVGVCVLVRQSPCLIRVCGGDGAFVRDPRDPRPGRGGARTGHYDAKYGSLYWLLSLTRVGRCPVSDGRVGG